MKIAFAHWDNRIAPVFDTVRQIYVVDVESGQIVSETQEALSEDLPVRKILRLVERGIGTLVCGAISRPMYGLVVANGIQVVPFVAGDLNEVIQAWLSGDLEDDIFAMPGYCGQRGRRFRGMYEESQEENAVRNAGRRSHTNAACLASSANARSVEPLWQGNNRQSLRKEETTMPRGDGTGPRGMGPSSGKGQGQGGQNPGRMGGPLAAGPIGYCVCPQCGQKEPHERAVPCVKRKCPKCGTVMARQ